MDQIEKFVRDRDIKMPHFDWNSCSTYGRSLDVWHSVFGDKDQQTKPPKSPKSPTPPHEKSKFNKFMSSPKSDHKLTSPKSPSDAKNQQTFEKIVNGIASNLQSLKAYSPLDHSASTNTNTKVPTKKNSR